MFPKGQKVFFALYYQLNKEKRNSDWDWDYTFILKLFKT
jgi:hypothetical protein